ncbi:MAG TPA: SCO family protein [Nitrosospira sp.]|nr:SCO family protein [Nitrosospira sp.]
MPELPLDSQVSELQFSTLVDEVKSDPARSALLVDLLREDHPIYDQRGTAATVRMRGWVLLAFERLGLPEAALVFVLEELDNGRDAYLVAAAARSLRSYTCPSPVMAAFLMRALANIQFHDDLVCLDHYGGYAVSQKVRTRGDTAGQDTAGGDTTTPGTTAVDELVMSLRWLGSDAADAVPAMEALMTDNAKGGGALSQTQLQELRAILESLRSIELLLEPAPFYCCTLPASIGTFRDWLAHAWSENTRPDALLNNTRDDQNIESIVFEDQDGEHVKFADFFYGQPSVVVFFYTRCTNPLKCSLTVTKLARLQKLLAERPLDGRICTAAITYDPEFDLAERLRGYGGSRGMRMDGDNRLLRAVEGIEPLRKYFRLGVNFIQSIVNRHRVELYVLDAAGRIAASFERIQWDENEVLERVATLLAKDSISTAARSPHSIENDNKEKTYTAKTSSFVAATRSVSSAHESGGSTLRGLPALSILSVAIAFFPKCPVCWAAYLSVFGIAGLEQLPYSPWLLPLLASLMLINLGSLRLQQRSMQGPAGFYLAAMGAFLILVCGIGLELPYASAAGIILTVMGSAISVLGSRNSASFQRSQIDQVSPGS